MIHIALMIFFLFFSDCPSENFQFVTLHKKLKCGLSCLLMACLCVWVTVSALFSNTNLEHLGTTSSYQNQCIQSFTTGNRSVQTRHSVPHSDLDLPTKRLGDNYLLIFLNYDHSLPDMCRNYIQSISYPTEQSTLL